MSGPRRVLPGLLLPGSVSAGDKLFSVEPKPAAAEAHTPPASR